MGNDERATTTGSNDTTKMERRSKRGVYDDGYRVRACGRGREGGVMKREVKGECGGGGEEQREDDVDVRGVSVTGEEFVLAVSNSSEASRSRDGARDFFFHNRDRYRL